MQFRDLSQYSLTYPQLITTACTLVIKFVGTLVHIGFRSLNCIQTFVMHSNYNLGPSIYNDHIIIKLLYLPMLYTMYTGLRQFTGITRREEAILKVITELKIPSYRETLNGD